MTVDDIKRLIRFDVESEGMYNRLIASFTLNCSVLMAKETRNSVQILDMAYKNLTEKIIRSLYDDHHRQLMESLSALRMTDPMNFVAQREAVDKVIAAARFQKSDYSLPEPEKEP